MRKHLVTSLVICGFLSLIGWAEGQTNPITVPGLATSLLSQPGSISLSPGTCNTSCTNGCQTWQYAVVALDSAGGNTSSGLSNTLSLSSSSLSPPKCGSEGDLGSTVYTKLTTTPVAGAASCVVYRVSPSAAKVAPASGSIFPCGSTFYDFGGHVDTSSPPTTTSTGSINAQGAVVGQAFFAGTGGSPAVVGTEVLNSGTTGLSTCSSPTSNQYAACIPQNGTFFEQAPTSFSGSSWGISWPSTTPTATLTPFMFGQVTGTPSTSPVTLGSLTNPSNSNLATASGALPNNHLLMGNSTGDVADSNIQLSSGKIPWDTIGGPQTSNQSLAMNARTTSWTWSGAQTGFEFNFQGGNGTNTTDYVQWQAGNNTGSKNFFDISDTTTNGSATGSLLNVSTSTGSTMIPFTATVAGTGSGIQLSNTGILSKIGTGHVNADQCNSNNCPFYTGSAPAANDLTKWGASGALVDDTALTDDGSTLSYSGSISTGGGKFTINSAGTITKMTNATIVGVPALIYDTVPGASGGNLGPTQMWPGASSGPHAGRFSWYVEQTGAGVACGGSSATTVKLNVIYTPPSASTAITQLLGQVTIATGNGAPGNFVSNGTYPIAIKSSQAVSYSTTNFAAGSGCTTSPTYTIYPVFELFF